MNYQFLNHIDAPKRVLTLTMDELVVTALSFILLILSNQKVLVSMLGLGLLSGLRHLKKGGSKGAFSVGLLVFTQLYHSVFSAQITFITPPCVCGLRREHGF